MKPEKLFDRIEAAILEEPKRIHMAEWVFDTKYLKASRIPECGTVACIAGWACAIGMRLNSKRLLEHRCRGDIPFDAGNLLKLESAYERNSLFLVSAWPDKWATRLSRHRPGTKAYAKVVVDYIRWWRQENRPPVKAAKSGKSHVMSTSGVGRDGTSNKPKATKKKHADKN